MIPKLAGLPAWLVVPVLAGLAACGGSETSSQSPAAGAEVASIEGEVFYRERMMLPPGAEVEVQLQDISRPDALASVMASVLLQPEGGPPYPFTIEYPVDEIDRSVSYALHATISHQGRLLFATADYINPFAGNPVEVLVRRAAEPVETVPDSVPPPTAEKAEP